MISFDNTLSNNPLTVREVIVIDSRVTDWKVLIAGLNPALPVVLLPAGGDGLAALAEALAPYGQLDALHLVSHGGSGYLLLGGGQLNSATLAAGNEALAALASHFTTYSDLLLYGCSVAAGEQGESFVTALSAELHGADIAASTDLTGPASLGGDWALEYTTGTLESVLPFKEQAMQEIEMNFGGSAPVIENLDGDSTTVEIGGAAYIDNKVTSSSVTVTGIEDSFSEGYLLIHQSSGNPGNFIGDPGTSPLLLFGSDNIIAGYDDVYVGEIFVNSSNG